MIVSRLRCADLPPGDGFALWHELTRHAHVRSIIHTPRRADFPAAIESLEFGWMQISSIDQPALAALRPDKVVRVNDPEAYQISLPRAGTMIVDQARRESTLGVGQAVLLDASRPGSTTNGDGYSHIVIQVSKAFLRPALVESFVNRPVPVHDGVGSALVAVLTALFANPESYGPADTARVGSVVVDLLGALFSPTAGAGGGLGVGRDTQRTAVLAHVELHLGDADLTPATVAADLGIPLRTLHALFSESGTTLGRWIRERRLDRCRRDLTDPALAARPAYAVGARWGFPDPAAFNRTFTKAFGVPPGEFRRLAALDPLDV